MGHCFVYDILEDQKVKGSTNVACKALQLQYHILQILLHTLGCPKMHKRWKCHAPEAKSDAKTLIFWENIKIWAQN